MEVISVILMFMFGNMNDQEHQMTQYIPMESISSCMKEVRLLKKKTTDYSKNAFCGPGIVHIENGEVIALYNEIPEGATMVKKKITKEAFERWTLKAKEKWNKD
tara:strand:+ start:4931 stop:5242 length:312 start_codon:yes stop_codon:yes gene_type:complete